MNYLEFELFGNWPFWKLAFLENGLFRVANAYFDPRHQGCLFVNHSFLGDGYFLLRDFRAVKPFGAYDARFFCRTTLGGFWCFADDDFVLKPFCVPFFKLMDRVSL